jgi:membrane-associated protease RseP (regulator of RpoE activity)
MNESVPPTAPSPGVLTSSALASLPVLGQLPALDEFDLGLPQRRRFLPLALFLATCLCTYAAGAYRWLPVPFGIDPANGDVWNFHAALQILVTNWRDGLTYMGCVMAILLAHEFGHFLMTVRYRVPATYPIFLPLPIMMMTGTMGAVIGMEGYRANRRQMFDIGLAGPLAGLVLTVPMVWIGIKIAHPDTLSSAGLIFGDPLLAKWLMHWLRPDLPSGAVPHNAVYMAGWVGMFVTGLNMMPVSQLDGGHVIYGLFLKRGHWIARAFLLSAIAFVILSGQYSWTLMVVLVTLIGVDHPPTSNDRMPLGRFRTILGLLSLSLPILCFTPFRLSLN